MRVLHVLNRLGQSTPEILLKLAASFWLANGADLHILVIDDTEGEYAGTLRDAGYRIHHMPSPKKTSILSWSAAYGRSIRAVSPDIIHIHTESFSSITATLPGFMGVPAFRTIHNNFAYHGCLKWQKMFERFLSRKAGCQHISIGTSVQANELRLGNPTILCWNWFDEGTFRLPSPAERAFARERLGVSGDSIILLSIGNGSPTKNYGSVVKALSIVGDKRLVYWQVGNESNEDRRLAENLNLGNQVVFLGSQKNVLPYLWAADTVVLPSLREGFSIAALEALGANGRCIIADVPGLSDLKSIGVDALWCAPTAVSVAEAISRSLKAGSIVDEARIKNSELVRSKFSVKARCNAYAQLWWKRPGDW